MSPRQLSIPTLAQELLARVPNHFYDDGCSRAPDSWFGFDFGWACRIHDWGYCTRSHPRGTMTPGYKVAHDHLLGVFVSASLPSMWKWIGPLYKATVLAVGFNSYHTCGVPPKGARPRQVDADLCRHDMPRPDWMAGAVRD